MIPTIVQSVGVSSRLNGNDASLPRHQKTSSPMPAPTASRATMGFPLFLRSASSVWTIRNLRPSRASFFTVATTVPITRAICILHVRCGELDLVDHADDRCVYGTVLVALRQTGRGASNDDHLFMKARADGIDSNDIAALIGAVKVDRLHDKQL